MNETSPIGEKKIHDHRRKTGENDNFLTKQSPFLSPNFIRGSTVIVIPHNVELCKQYFLQECLLLKLVQSIFSNCFHGKRPLWELKLVQRAKTSIFIVNKRLKDAKVKFLIEHDKKEFK